MPGYTLQVQRLSSTATEVVVRVQVLPDAGLPSPSVVQCWVGGVYDPAVAMVSATPVTGVRDAFDATLALPFPLPDASAVWVRLSLPDGAIVEAGRTAFPL